ncbi:hypothetical protein [Bacillus wiedmannii]|uniref:hypothetical protein n=1 Tax=Bacillus wiedmannii TaxID=1890302 RepID=UPI001155E103|nr:hypothetical protein [Bacillus wiedmannii]
MAWGSRDFSFEGAATCRAVLSTLPTRCDAFTTIASTRSFACYKSLLIVLLIRLLIEERTKKEV